MLSSHTSDAPCGVRAFVKIDSEFRRNGRLWYQRVLFLIEGEPDSPELIVAVRYVIHQLRFEGWLYPAVEVDQDGRGTWLRYWRDTSARDVIRIESELNNVLAWAAKIGEN